MVDRFNKTETAASLVVKLAIACNVKEIRINIEGGLVLHPSLSDLQNWICENLNIDEFDSFYKEVRKIAFSFPTPREAQSVLPAVRQLSKNRQENQKAITHNGLKKEYSKEVKKKLWEPVWLAREYPQELDKIMNHYFCKGYPKVLQGIEISKYIPIGLLKSN